MFCCMIRMNNESAADCWILYMLLDASDPRHTSLHDDNEYCYHGWVLNSVHVCRTSARRWRIFLRKKWWRWCSLRRCAHVGLIGLTIFVINTCVGISTPVPCINLSSYCASLSCHSLLRHHLIVFILIWRQWDFFTISSLCFGCVNPIIIFLVQTVNCFRVT